MINFDYAAIKNALLSINIFNLNFYSKEKKKEEIIEIKIERENEIADKKSYKDRKTMLYGFNLPLIRKIEDNITVYIFIEKYKELSGSAWNSVVPIILEESTKKIIQFGRGSFALEGCGGGLGNTRSLIYYLKMHIDKGYKVSLLPKVIDNKLLYSYEYIDSGIELADLVMNSVDLINYQKDSLKWIYKQYQELLSNHEINAL